MATREEARGGAAPALSFQAFEGTPPSPVPTFDPSTLLSRRLLLFTGKGGVGKSTVVASLAMEAARRGGRPLVVELGQTVTHDVSVERVVYGSLVGSVLINGSPAAEVTVMANPVDDENPFGGFGWNNMVKTDEQGAFEMRRLRPGRYRTSVSRSWSKSFPRRATMRAQSSMVKMPAAVAAAYSPRE